MDGRDRAEVQVRVVQETLRRRLGVRVGTETARYLLRRAVSVASASPTSLPGEPLPVMGGHALTGAPRCTTVPPPLILELFAGASAAVAATSPTKL